MSSKYSISIRAETLARLKKRSKEVGRSMRCLVEEATRDCVVPDAHSSSPDTSPAPISSSSSCDTAST